jgi:hypothetical protein
MITKKRVIEYLKCKRAAFLQKFHKTFGIDKNTLTAHKRYIMQSGIDAENHYRTFRKDGVLVEDGQGWSFNRFSDAIYSTANLIMDGETRLFQAAFATDDDVYTLCDEITVDDKDSSHLIINEVKASTSVKPEHLLDVAVQSVAVLDNEYELDDIMITHLDNTKKMDDGIKMYKTESVKSRVLDIIPKVRHAIGKVKELFSDGIMPEPTYQKACFDCDFGDYCLSELPDTNILTPPHMHHSRIALLQSNQILDVRDIPDDFPLTDAQSLYVSTVNTGEAHIDKDGIRTLLKQLTYPIAFMDFETYNYSLPIVPDTKPWEQVPFQFSIHTMSREGTISHDEYLFTRGLKSSDIRKNFLLRLLESLETNDGSIIVYNAGFEKSILKRLAQRFLGYSERINSIIDRIWDLELIFKNHYTDPRFLGKTKLKVVAPTLIEECDYSDLEIDNGGDATRIWAELMKYEGKVLPVDDMIDIVKSSDNLLRYCAMDTWVMVKLFTFIYALVNIKDEQIALPFTIQPSLN